MCLTILEPKYSSRNHGRPLPLIAEKDIVCYKKLRSIRSNKATKLLSPYIRMEYRVGKTYTVRNFSYSEHNFAGVNRGLHAYTSLYKAKQEIGNTIVKCIIPKGTQYFLGLSCTIVAKKLKLVRVVK